MATNKDNFYKHLKDKDINQELLGKIKKINREDYFDEALNDSLYSTSPLPIGFGQISDDPTIMAKMIQILAPKKEWKLLEVGTGSGYSTAILSSLVSEVITVEDNEQLAIKAKNRITDAGIENVRFFAGDATDPEMSLETFDGIIVFAACLQTPLTLINSLSDNGAIVFPMGPSHQQQITMFKHVLNKDKGLHNYTFHELCEFVSIRGHYGWLDQVEDYITDDAQV